MIVLAGTSGSAFKEWRGAFYPVDLPDEGQLRYYASQFPTVEINNTFYRLPKEHVLAGWAAQVPEGFVFAIKASQRITHFGRLKPESKGALDFLLQSTSVLGPKLGPILFQCPANLRKDADRLASFLDYLPKDRRFVFEFRDASWFDGETFALLRAHDVALCAIDQEDFASPVARTAAWGYLRLHRLDYSDADLKRWVETIAAQGWRDAYVYFKHDEAEEAVSRGGGMSGPTAVRRFCARAEP